MTQHRNMAERPGHGNLLAFEEVIVNSIHDSCNYSAFRRRDLSTKLRCKRGTARVSQIGFLEKNRGHSWLRNLHKFSLSGEILFLVFAGSASQLPGQERATTHFCHRRKGCNRWFTRFALPDQFYPAVPRNVLDQFAVDSEAHTVDYDQKHWGNLGGR